MEIDLGYNPRETTKYCLRNSLGACIDIDKFPYILAFTRDWLSAFPTKRIRINCDILPKRERRIMGRLVRSHNNTIEAMVIIEGVEKEDN